MNSLNKTVLLSVSIKDLSKIHVLKNAKRNDLIKLHQNKKCKFVLSKLIYILPFYKFTDLKYYIDFRLDIKNYKSINDETSSYKLSIIRDEFGMKQSIYFQNKLMPAEIYHLKNGNMYVWYKNDLCHREEIINGYTLPAMISYDSLVWCLDGKLYRKDRDKNGNLLPAKITKIKNKTKYMWFLDQSKVYDVNIKIYKSYLNGIIHNEDKNGNILPAVIVEENGKIIEKQYYLYGKKIK